MFKRTAEMKTLDIASEVTSVKMFVDARFMWKFEPFVKGLNTIEVVFIFPKYTTLHRKWPQITMKHRQNTIDDKL